MVPTLCLPVQGACPDPAGLSEAVALPGADDWEAYDNSELGKCILFSDGESALQIGSDIILRDLILAGPANANVSRVNVISGIKLLVIDSIVTGAHRGPTAAGTAVRGFLLPDNTAALFQGARLPFWRRLHC
jgi:hypothetical protein